MIQAERLRWRGHQYGYNMGNIPDSSALIVVQPYVAEHGPPIRPMARGKKKDEEKQASRASSDGSNPPLYLPC